MIPANTKPKERPVRGVSLFTLLLFGNQKINKAMMPNTAMARMM